MPTIRRSDDPTIRRFANCKISIYADDHLPPHFHIEGRGFRAVVEIETMLVWAGDVRKAPDALRGAMTTSSCCAPNGAALIGERKNGENRSQHQIYPP
jgi:hypothetical protein